MQALIDPKRPLREIPKRQRRALAKPLDDDASSLPDRDSAIVAAFRSGAFSMQAIAEHFGVSRMTVSRAVRRHEGVSETSHRHSDPTGGCGLGEHAAHRAGTEGPVLGPNDVLTRGFGTPAYRRAFE